MERRPGKKKLSKNLLEMKFMKRTKEKTEKMDEEEVRARMFDGEVNGAMRDGATRIIVEPSYVNIENLRFGRMAFKGNHCIYLNIINYPFSMFLNNRDEQ